MRATGLRHWLRLIFTGLGAAVFAVCLVVGGFLAGLTLGHPLLAFGLPILGAVLSLCLAQFFSLSLEPREPRGDDPFAARPRTSWKLCDPDLRNSGVWRAGLGPGSPDVAGLDDPTRIREVVEHLIADWSQRIGWPYLGCRVVRVVPAGGPKARPLGSSDDRARTYRVTLDLGGGEWDVPTRHESGRLRIGPGLAEFQLEPAPESQYRAPDPDRAYRDLEADGMASPSPPIVDAIRARTDPMWDRWLDG
jgi:hypothetical protein